LPEVCKKPLSYLGLKYTIDLWRGHSELTQQIYLLSNARTFVNVVQHLRDFGRFEMNERDLDRQRGGRILVAKDDIPHEILPGIILINVWVGIVENHVVGPYVLPPPHYVQNAAQEIRENRIGILNRVRLLGHVIRTEVCITNNFFDLSFYAFTHNYSIFTLLFTE
jgi:hypothetical protein